MAYFFGSHDRMKDHQRRVGLIARSGLPVLIEGECGTGKEALAELIHELGGMGGGFTRILCRQSGPVLPQAWSNGNGAVELSQLHNAASGTIFLKNVHVLSPAVQEQFLTTLEQGDENNGSAPTAVRLISSATESLEDLVGRHDFNAALYYRLSVYRVTLPPLRQRVGDIPELLAEMLRRFANGSVPGPPVPAAMLDALMTYDWPGNLRELHNVARA